MFAVGTDVLHGPLWSIKMIDKIVILVYHEELAFIFTIFIF